MLAFTEFKAIMTKKCLQLSSPKPNIKVLDTKYRMSWITLNATSCFPKQITPFLYLEDKTICTAEAGPHTHTFVLETKAVSPVMEVWSGHPLC